MADSERSVYLTMLFDIFGGLLTDRQREYFNLYYNMDLSLAEIAGDDGISRQSVRDTIVRAENTLLYAEEKTGLLKSQGEFLKLLNDALKKTDEIISLSENDSIKTAATELRDILTHLKG